MLKMLEFRSMTALFAQFCLYIAVAVASAQSSKVLGEVKFEGATKVERDSGVWVDGGYVGYLKELKGDKKVLLLPGEHQIAVRQSGYDDFMQKIVVEPGQTQTVRVVAPDAPGTHSQCHRYVEGNCSTGTRGCISR